MESRGLSRKALVTYTLAIVAFMFLPILSFMLASFNKSRFFSFPFQEWTSEWYVEAFSSSSVRVLAQTTVTIAVVVTVLGTVFGFAGAMAFARFPWRGQGFFQKFIVLPIFFPQAVLGLALLLWFNTLSIQPSWQTAVLAHLVWVVPVVTLIISIQVYAFDDDLEAAARDLGASRWQTFREITFPILFPAIRTGAIFAFLLSWLNFPLSLFTTGADSTLPVWIYAKMTSGYTPLVPALGTLTIIIPIMLVITLVLVVLLYRSLRTMRWSPRPKSVESVRVDLQ
jgi:spermidine/putrescine transport system permease protein